METNLQLTTKKRLILIPFLYEFFGASIITYAYNFGSDKSDASQQPDPTEQRSITRACAYFMCWLLANSISGAHFNPATSTAVYLYQREYKKHFWLYFGFIVSQFLGCFFGILLSFMCVRYHGPPMLYPNASIGVYGGESLYFEIGLRKYEDWHIKYGRVIGQEVLQTFTFTLIFLIVKYKTSLQKVDDITKGLILAIALYAVYEMALRSGECLNPAFGLAQSCYMFGYYHFFTDKSSNDVADAIWIYMVFPFVGAILATLVYWLLEKLEVKENVEATQAFKDVLKN